MTTQAGNGSPDTKGAATDSAGSYFSSSIPWVAVARALGGIIGGSRDTDLTPQQRAAFERAGGTISHARGQRGNPTYTIDGSKVGKRVARQVARAEMGKRPYINPNAGTYTNPAGERLPQPPKNWRGSLSLWEDVMRATGRVQPPPVVINPPPRYGPPNLPVVVNPPRPPSGRLPPDFVTRELVAEAYAQLGEGIWRELLRRKLLKIQREIDAKHGPKSRARRARARARAAARPRPPVLEPVVITSDRLPQPIVVESLPTIVPSPVIVPGPAPTAQSPPWYKRIPLPKLTGALSPTQLAELLLRGGPAPTNIRLRDPLTVVNNPAVPSPGTGSYFGGTTGTKSKTCSCSKPRKRKSTKQPREVCYRGTYTETSTGLIKRKARKVPCK